MGFQHEFLDAIQSDATLTKTSSIHDFLPLPVEKAEGMDIPQSFLSVLGYNMLQANHPYKYRLSGLDCYCLIYTRAGSGTAHVNGQTLSLTSGSLLLLDCRDSHRIEVKQSPWNYFIVFTKGDTLSYLYEVFAKPELLVYTPAEHSEIPLLLTRLEEALQEKPANPLTLSRFLFNILSLMILEKQQQEELMHYLPLYLKEIKKEIDLHYDRPISLTELEEKYGISRFRICRDFRTYLGDSPMQYVITRRMEKAKELLLRSDKKVFEIAENVGIFNTNYFIRLFKQQYDITPQEYRKNPPLL